MTCKYTIYWNVNHLKIWLLSLALVIPLKAIPNFDIWSSDQRENQLSAPVITRSISCGAGSACSSRSAQMFNRASCCYSVRFMGTILAHIFLIPNSSVFIKRTVSHFMFTSSAININVQCKTIMFSYIDKFHIHWCLYLMTDLWNTINEWMNI